MCLLSAWLFVLGFVSCVSVHFLLVIVSLVVSTSAVDSLEKLVSKMTIYASSGC